LHAEKKKLSPCFTDHKRSGMKFDYVASNMTRESCGVDGEADNENGK
jgi:hypothetical protein